METGDANLSLETARYELEKEKFDWEQDKHKQELLAQEYRYLSRENLDYLKIVTQVTIAYFTLSGILVSQYLIHGDESLELALWIPCILGLILGGLYFWCIQGTHYTDQEFERICNICYNYSPKSQSQIHELLKCPDLKEEFENYGQTHSNVIKVSTPIRAALYSFGVALVGGALFCFCLITKSAELTSNVSIVAVFILILIRIIHHFELIDKAREIFPKRK